MKHNFDDIYAQTTPSQYAAHIIGELDYQLPFIAMHRLRPLCESMSEKTQPLNITVLGSSYGLEAAFLKSQLTTADLLARWMDETTVYEVFPKTPQYRINFVDIQPEPLEYAQQVGLCDQYIVADMSKPFADDLLHLLKSESDLITGIGLAYYIGKTGFEQLVQTAFVDGNAQVLCYSLPNYHDETDVKAICRAHGVSLEPLGDTLRQRNYANEKEKASIHAQLKAANNFSAIDEDHISTHLYLLKQNV